MRYILLLLFVFPMSVLAEEISQYVCNIGGVYQNEDGKLIQRKEKKALGKIIYVNADSGEVTGYFGTGGWQINKINRPIGLKTIETAYGLLGDGVNILSIEPLQENSNKYSFFYTKNWLYISGQCSTVKRHE